MIFIFSSARSGSTWLAKIFDSHPEVMYLHEPDIADRGLDLLPMWFEDQPNAAQLESARTYLDRLLAARTPRATGTRPFFPKSYRGSIAERFRQGLIYLAKGSERVGFKHYTNHIHIPDLSLRGSATTCVIKSVTALGRVETLLKAASGAIRPILLIRHPCGYIGSELRGHKLGVMGSIPSPGRLLDTRTARRLGVRESAIAAGDEIEKLAWDWLLSNAEAYSAIRAAGGTTVIYETLASNLQPEARKLFSQVDLPWAPQTEAFLRRSSESEGSYYSVFRDPIKAANRWREELGDDTVARIKAIVSRDPIGQLFFVG